VLVLLAGISLWHRHGTGRIGFTVWRALSGKAHDGRYEQINDVRMYYETYGSGPPVLVLHGGNGSLRDMREQIRTLSQTHLVIAPDLRGHGRSGDGTLPLGYDLMADDLVLLLDRLRIQRADVVGWSDGGIIGIDLAIKHPDRLRRLFAFGANADPAGQIEGADGLPGIVAHTAIEKDEYRALSPTPEGWDSLNAAINTMWNTLPQFSAAQLHSIRVPTTIADGQYDEFIKPEHTRYMAAQIPGSNLVILPNVSHFAMLQDPAKFNDAVLRFLAN